MFRVSMGGYPFDNSVAGTRICSSGGVVLYQPTAYVGDVGYQSSPVGGSFGLLACVGCSLARHCDK